MKTMILVSMFVTLACASGCTYASIGDGEVGVVRTPSGVAAQPLQTGDWQIGRGDTVTHFNARSQQGDERLEVLASNGLKIVLDTSIRYHISANDVVALDKEVGEDYYGVLVRPTLSSQARRVVGRYQPEEIYSTEREQIEKQIYDGVSKALNGRHVEIEAVLIRNVQLPDSIQAAINDKLTAEQAALKTKYVIAQAQADADREKIAAQSKADAVRVEAQSRADAKRLDGQALADYQKSMEKSLTPEVLKYYQIQASKDLAAAPSSKLIFVNGQNAPQTILDMRTDPAKKTDNPY
jgi:regulator of protease activity HflC (stomatin/prohibitin superfamily)